MPERAIDRRRRESDRTPADEALRSRPTDAVLALQRTAGNRAVADMLARAPAAKGATGTIQIGGVGTIKVSGGNLAAWITDPQHAKPGNNMPAVPLTPQDVSDLVDYLMELK